MSNILYENGFPVYAIVNGKMVEVQEVRHGTWVDSNGLMRCSICRKSPDEVIYIPCEEWNYCPNCGAKMVNEDDDTD